MFAINISPSNSTQSLTFQPNYPAREKNNVEQSDKTTMRNTFNEAKDKVMEPVMHNGKAYLSEYDERMMKSVKVSAGITGTMEEFDKITEEIKERHPEGELRDKHLGALNNAFDSAASFYAGMAKRTLLILSTMPKILNFRMGTQNVAKGSPYYHQGLKNFEKIFDSKTLDQIEKSIYGVFMNAKDYYVSNGTLDGFSSEKTKAGSAMLTLFNKVQEDLTNFVTVAKKYKDTL